MKFGMNEEYAVMNYVYELSLYSAYQQQKKVIHIQRPIVLKSINMNFACGL